MTKETRKKLIKMVQPKTIYAEMAEYGYLEDYLGTFLKDKYTNDAEFKEEMFDVLLTYSKAPIPEIELHYLEQLCEGLNYFLEYTKKCRIQKQ